MTTTIKLIDSAEIAAMLGVSRDHAVARITKLPDFPEPAVNLSQKLRRWNLAEVQRWMLKARQQRRRQTPGSTPAATAADRDDRRSAPSA